MLKWHNMYIYKVLVNSYFVRREVFVNLLINLFVYPQKDIDYLYARS